MGNIKAGIFRVHSLVEGVLERFERLLSEHFGSKFTSERLFLFDVFWEALAKSDEYSEVCRLISIDEQKCDDFWDSVFSEIKIKVTLPYYKLEEIIKQVKEGD